jgi:Ca-activated chloride channel family protein
MWLNRGVKVTSVAAVALLALAPHLAQQKPPLKSSVELTVVTVTVRDANGRLVTGLGRDAFKVYEDGAPVAVAQFTNQRVPLGLGLLLDVSDSMVGRRLNDARTAVERFLLDLLAPTDAFFLMAFNHEPHLLFGWKTDPTGVHEALAKLWPSGGTAIYDAIVAAEPYIANRPRERAALVLITDGADTASDTTFHDLQPTLVRTDTFVYAIAIDTPEPQPIASRVNVEALTDITSQTGGYTEVVRDTADLQTATANIADELNKQYVLGYSSPHPGDGQYHSIRVRTVDPTYRVHARNGYIALKR